MKLSAKIIVEANALDIEKLFASEEKAFQNQRASYTIRREKSRTVFIVSAEDCSALRAVLNSITKLLSVYEKTEKVIRSK
jgi:tRNA threonylcarbamoyladenosine modification (KEOPS) complex  Pcc1 subunit